MHQRTLPRRNTLSSRLSTQMLRAKSRCAASPDTFAYDLAAASNCKKSRATTIPFKIAKRSHMHSRRQHNPPPDRNGTSVFAFAEVQCYFCSPLKKLLKGCCAAAFSRLVSCRQDGEARRLFLLPIGKYLLHFGGIWPGLAQSSKFFPRLEQSSKLA